MLAVTRSTHLAGARTLNATRANYRAGNGLNRMFGLPSHVVHGLLGITTGLEFRVVVAWPHLEIIEE